MTELDMIMHMEYEFPKIFTNMELRDFGILFHNQLNDDSYDSNHALIINECNYELAVKEIKVFYLSRKLSPRIYSALKEDQLHELRPILEKEGFTIDDYGYTDYIVFSGTSQINTEQTLDFRRFSGGDDLRVFDSIFSDITTRKRVKEVVRRRSMSPMYYLYIGYLGDIPVVMASMQFDENMTARLDEVETAESHRKKGYARQITRFLTDLFTTLNGKLFYTWAANDTAQRIYIQGGFEIKYRLPSWSAQFDI